VSISTRDAILRGLNKSKQGRARRLHNFYNSPAYPDKLIRLFNTTFKEVDFGKPPPVTKQVKGMLNGFIKVCRSNSWNERSIYEAIKDLVIHWDYIKKQEHHTLKGSRATLGDRPSLLEFLICRESILTAIDKARRQNILEAEETQTQVVEVTRKKKKTGPTEEELENEYNKMMENY